MWYVLEKCNVYGEDDGVEFNEYNEAFDYFERQSKSEEVCRGYFTLYLFEIINSISNPMKGSVEYDFVEETSELIPSKKPKIRLLADGIERYGQKWENGDVGVVFNDNKYRIDFSINGAHHKISKGHPMYDGEYEYIIE